jgi:hypothetical protein
MDRDEERLAVRDAWQDLPDVTPVAPAFDSDTDQLIKCGKDSCPCRTDDRYQEREAERAHAEMVARIRAIAPELEWLNGLCDYDLHSGQWSPNSLRYEAAYLEYHP